MIKINCALLLVLSLASVAFSEKNDNDNEEPLYLQREQPESMFTSSDQEAPAEQADERPRGITFEYAFSTSHSSPYFHGPSNFETNNNDDSDLKFLDFNKGPPYLRARGFERQAHEFARQSLPSYSKHSFPLTKDIHSFPPFPKLGRLRPLPSSSASTSPFSSPPPPTTTPYSVEPPNLSTTPSLPSTSHTQLLSNIYLKNDKRFNNLKATKSPPNLLNYFTNSHHFMRRFGYDNEEDYEEPMFNDGGESMYDHEARVMNPNLTRINPNSKVKMLKVMMGKKNDHGKPWGSKTMLYYHNPRSPDNYMHFTEVNMNMNSRKHSGPADYDVDFEMFNDQSQVSSTSVPPFMFEEDNYEPGPGDMF